MAQKTKKIDDILVQITFDQFVNQYQKKFNVTERFTSVHIFTIQCLYEALVKNNVLEDFLNHEVKVYEI
jgi:hypothetical protein